MTDYKGNAHDAQRIKALEKQRAIDKEEFERKKNEIERKHSVDVKNMAAKFAVTYDSVEDQLKRDTIGLVHLEDFTKRRETLVQQAEFEKIAKQQKREQEESQRRKRKKPDVVRSTLSFSLLDEEEQQEQEHQQPSGEGSNSNAGGGRDEKQDRRPAQTNINGNSPTAVTANTTTGSAQNDEAAVENDDNAADITSTDQNPATTGEPAPKKKKVVKNPFVDTSFLPDEDREKRELEEREAIRRQWLEQQEKIKAETIQITYSFWDGTGHRRSVQLTKGTTIERFLDAVRHEFKELSRLTADQLMFIKEDLIIPSHYSFYDLIVTKARGKSGPLFHWDVHDDIRLQSDASKEKEESHAGKVVERSWYERNKHIFPASRWEVYDPNKKFEKYTIK